MSAVSEYLAAVDAGQRVDRQQFLARHTNVADDLRDWLDGLAFVDSAVREMWRTDGACAGQAKPSEADAIDRSLAESLGDFRLCRPIGRGGMGVVYEAIQLSLGRRVAVKILPLAAALDARQLQRFKNEAYAAAQLHHNNIVPVYAIGCERSVHFYAMQLIHGQSLAAVIAELRANSAQSSPQPATDEPESTTSWQVSGEPGNDRQFARPTSSDKAHAAAPTSKSPSSTTRAYGTNDLSTLRTSRRSDFFRHVARMGLQAAEALEYAHRQGVVHRDIKPQNILLDVESNLWITDFGLAQFYQDARLTQTGAMVGTLRYMSPEQAAGSGAVLDERADVYSLGATIYELLTLEPALPGQTHTELLQQIGSLEPRLPRSIDRAIPIELETIIGKAIAKDARDRYRTAGELGDDLRRFLQDEPIRARPPSLWDRAVKWTRRHKAVAASALAFLLLATLVSLMSTVLIAREQAKTRAALRREQEQRQQAERSFRQAREVVDAFARIAVDEMNGPEFVHVRRRMLYAASIYYQQFLRDYESDPSIAADLATAQRSVDEIHNEILVDMTAIDGFFRLLSLTELLEAPTVLDNELRLPPDRQQQALDLARELRKEMEFPRLHELMRQSPETKRQEVAALNERAERGLAAFLTAEQQQRLRQVARQDQGPLAFTEQDVVMRLGLSAEQLEVVRSIQDDYREARFARRPTPGPDRHRHRDPVPHHDEVMRLKQSAVAEILTHLRPEQVETWKQLCGPPAQVDHLPTRFSRPPPRPLPRLDD